MALTEAGKERRASLHVVDGEAALAELDAGGLELLSLRGAEGEAAFAERLRAEPDLNNVGTAITFEGIWFHALGPCPAPPGWHDAAPRRRSWPRLQRRRGLCDG